MNLTEEEIYEIEFERISKRFPDANFSISLSFHEDTILSKEETIFIKITRDCYCYEEILPPLYIRVKKSVANKDGISYADCIDEMIKSEFNTNEMCNHIFLELIKQIKDSITYECWFGS